MQQFLDTLKAPYPSKIDTFLSKKCLINCYIVYGIWQPIKFQLVSSFWPVSKMKWLFIASLNYSWQHEFRDTIKTHFISKTRNASVWHRCPRPGPSSPTRRYFAKNVEKRAITLKIIGRFYPKLNLTILYDDIPWYKIWIQYTNQSFFLKIIGRKTSFEGEKET